MASCKSYKIVGKTGVLVKSTNTILPFYQTTQFEGNTYTDIRHQAIVTFEDEKGHTKKTKADYDGTFSIKLRTLGEYTANARFTDEVFVTKKFKILSTDTLKNVELIVK